MSFPPDDLLALGISTSGPFRYIALEMLCIERPDLIAFVNRAECADAEIAELYETLADLGPEDAALRDRLRSRMQAVQEREAARLAATAESRRALLAGEGWAAIEAAKRYLHAR